MSSFEIRDNRSSALVRFSGLRVLGRGAYDEARFLVEIDDDGMSAKLEVPDLVSTSWQEFFSDLAACWTGWSGERSLSSVERHLDVTASCDSLGHVSLKVSISENPLHGGWRAESILHLELGQLEGLAKQAKAFFCAAA